jgi:membrane protein YdbS with pleckstrin-like domain
MEPQKVDPATVNVWRCEAVFTVMALSLLGLLVALVRLPGPLLGAMVLAASIAIVVAWVLPSAQYHALDYEVDDAGISIRSGIVTRSHPTYGCLAGPVATQVRSSDAEAIHSRQPLHADRSARPRT